MIALPLPCVTFPSPLYLSAEPPAHQWTTTGNLIHFNGTCSMSNIMAQIKSQNLHQPASITKLLSVGPPSNVSTRALTWGYFDETARQRAVER